MPSVHRLGLVVVSAATVAILLATPAPSQDDDIPADVYDVSIEEPDRAPASVPVDYSDHEAGIETYLKFYRVVTGANGKTSLVEVDPRITDTFGDTRKVFNSSGQLVKKRHQGWDLSADEGTLVTWVNPGRTTVRAVKHSPWPNKNNVANYGHQVFVEAQVGDTMYVFQLAHLQSDIAVGKGDTIKAEGQPYGIKLGEIGTSGRPPNATNPHLHLEVRKADMSAVDPKTVFGP